MWGVSCRRGLIAKSLSTYWARATCQHLSSTSGAGGQKNIIKSPIPDVELPSGNVVNYLFNSTSKWADKIATECSLTGRRYSYAQLMDKVARWGGMLTKLGVHKGDVIAMALPNCPEYPIILFGALSIGASVTTINASYTAEEISRQLGNSGAKVLVGDPLLEGTLQEALKIYKNPTHLIMNGPSACPGAYNLLNILEDPTIPFADPVQLTGDEIAVLPYSSGTTGPPKGVVVSHNALSSHIPMFTHPYFFATKETTATYQDAFMCVLPFYHIYGMAPIMTCGLFSGVKLVTVTKFDPNTFVKSIRDHKAHTLHLVTPILLFLLNSPSATPESLSHIESILCGATPVPPSAVHALKDKLNSRFFFQEGFGMSEVIITMVTPYGEERIGTIGQLLPNVTAKVIDMSTGEALPPNADGEICLKTPSMMTGYYNNEKATAETIDSEGWLHTGDVGHYDEKGFFKIVDRTKELIKVKGLQVSPSELEDILLQHPDVEEVGVVGIPNERLGEAPRAYIVTKKPVSEDDIHRFLEPRVAPHKKLAGGIAFIDSLPKTASGKILKKDLKKMVTG